MRKFLFLLLLMFFVITSCESNDPETIPICKLYKYDKYASDDTLTLYRTELVRLNNLVTQRLNYGNVLSGSAGGSVYGLINRDSIFYNLENQVEKITYTTTENTLRKYDLFFYDLNNPNPIRRERVWEYAGGYVDKWIETISYENGKIKTTTGYFDLTPNFVDITDYTYNSDGNLTQTVEVSHPNQNSYEVIKTTEYSNYDDKTNPFTYINVPFVENRTRQYSNNNYRKVNQITREDNIVTGTSNWEISNYQYNALGYPLIGEYICD